MMDDDMQAIEPKADSFWKQKKSDTLGLFGATHVNTTPVTWSAQFLGSKYIWAFSQHILWCQQKTSQFLRNVSNRESLTCDTAIVLEATNLNRVTTRGTGSGPY
eukprot:2500930-Ditylum_brightwellii.AAC.1